MKWINVCRLAVALFLVAALLPPQYETRATSYLVFSTDDSGPGTLRWAIEQANLTSSEDIIEFNIPLTSCDDGICTIQPLTDLPILEDSGTTIDGTTQTVNQGNTNPIGPEIEIDGSRLILPTIFSNGLTIVSANNVIKGLKINQFPLNGIVIYGITATNNLISGNIIGEENLTCDDYGNGLDGVFIGNGASNNTIGGNTPEERNIISCNGWDGVGVHGAATNSNIIQGNYIGLRHNGRDAKPNSFHGVYIYGNAKNNVIGGTGLGDGNYISGNLRDGVRIHGTETSGNVVIGNFIGDADYYLDSVKQGNGMSGVQISHGAHDNTIGGEVAGAGNLIVSNIMSGVVISGTQSNIVAGNSIGMSLDHTQTYGNGENGISLQSDAKNNTIGGDSELERNWIGGSADNGINISGSGTSGNTISGNYIGTNGTEVDDFGNGMTGINIESGANGNTIGGSTPGERNIISGNNVQGIHIAGAGTSNNTITGNYIGTNANGSAKLGNNGVGVFIGFEADNNVVGGSGTGEGNLISGNGNDGIAIMNAPGTRVVGNYIGTNVGGSSALGNGGYGVYLYWGASGVKVGGDSAGERNIISGNEGGGIHLMHPGTSDNTISGNYIGTDASGTAAMPNFDYAINIHEGAAGNTIGGDTPGERNLIAGDEFGISIIGDGSSGNLVSGNYIGVGLDGNSLIGELNYGVYIDEGAQANIIGGDTSGEGNLISGALDSHVYISGTTTTNNVVAGNLIGTNASGTDVFRTDSKGVEIGNGAHHNTIGGDTPSERNLISGNVIGVIITGTLTISNTVSGNFIGTDLSGSISLGNNVGIVIIYDSQDNMIGGDTAGERNLISGNMVGILIGGNGSRGNQVQGNYIGTNADGSGPLANYDDGVYLAAGAQDNTIGPDNVIAYNLEAGVEVVYIEGMDAVLGNDITMNSIYANDKGISLLNGAHGGISAPVIDGDVHSPNLTGTACAGCTVEVFANSDTDGEGELYLGSVSANPSGVFTFPVGTSSARFYTATATDTHLGTSEFSTAFDWDPTIYLPVLYSAD